MATGPAREDKDNFVLITGMYVPALKRKNLTEKIHMTVYKSRLVYGVHYTMVLASRASGCFFGRPNP